MEIEKATSEEYSIWIYERKKCLDLSRSWDDRADEKEEEVRYFFFQKKMKIYKSNKKKKKISIRISLKFKLKKFK